MVNPVTKPNLCLFVLLAGSFLGLAGRAEAGFVAGHGHDLLLDNDWTTGVRDSGGMGGALPLPKEGDSSPDPTPPQDRDLPTAHFLGFGTCSSDTSMGGSSSSVSPSSGSGLTLWLMPFPWMTRGESSEQLALADVLSEPPPFPSRLFRPPR